jgi:hypothetical protein
MHPNMTLCVPGCLFSVRKFCHVSRQCNYLYLLSLKNTAIKRTVETNFILLKYFIADMNHVVIILKTYLREE